LRHGLSSSGEKYPNSKFKPGDTISVMLDMDEGSLSYSINGQYLGVAFQSEDLKTGELYPAVAPVYNTDCFEIRQPMPED
jgi:hypothetical protein